MESVISLSADHLPSKIEEGISEGVGYFSATKWEKGYWQSTRKRALLSASKDRNKSIQVGIRKS
jgi:hypothetical protein